MLESAKINDVVRKAASSVLKRQAGVQRVFSEPTSDSQGRDALHITIVPAELSNEAKTLRANAAR
jgi:hypothetical protein